MRRFEFSEGNSNKFWQITLQGPSFLVQFGKIGTAGQTQKKEFAGDAAARTEHDKLIAEKKKKGYVEVAVAADAATPAVTPPEAEKTEEPATAKKPAAPKKAAAETAKPAAEAPKAPAVETAKKPAAPAPAKVEAFEPTPVLQMTDAERAAAREGWVEGVELPPLAAPALLASLQTLIAADKEAAGWPSGRAKADDGGKAVIDHLLATYASGKAPAALDPALEAGAATLLRDREELAALASYWVARAGLSFALDAFAHARQYAWGYEYKPKAIWVTAADPATNWDTSLSHAPRRLVAMLRALVDQASAPDRSAAHAHAAELRGRHPVATSHGFALIFRDEKWAAEDAAAVLEITDARTTDASDLLYLLRERSHLEAFGKRFPPEHVMALLAAAGLEAVGVIAARLDDQYKRDGAAEALARVESVEAARALAGILDKKSAAPTARAYFEKRPALALVTLGALVAGGSKMAPYAEPLLKSVLRDHPDLPARLGDALDARTRGWIAEQQNARERRPAAPADLPAALAAPPWLAKRPTSALPTLTLDVLGPYVPPDWDAEKRERIVSRMDPYGWALKQANIPENAPKHTPEMDALVRAALPSLRYYKENIVHLATDAFLLGGLENGSIPHLEADYWFARFGEKLWPKCVEMLADNAQSVLSTFRTLKEPRLARAVAFALDKKTLRKDAVRWLGENAELAATGLVPLAFGANKHERAAAQKALRVIDARNAPALEAVAARYGDAAQKAVAQLLALPADEYPSKLPAAPKFVDVAALPALALKDGKGDLPESATLHLITALQLSPLEQPLSILEGIADAFEPRSAAEFAWALFSAWLAADASSKDVWAFWAVGHLGDDDAARRLTPMIRAWPGESAHARAVVGLDVLARIGTDVALMHLHGIAQKLKFKGLQEKAREKIDAVAEARGLTADELADRLVPDLGLDDSGTLVLDYGPRQFVVGFDETLKPFVTDPAGKRSGDPPKPGKSDDAERAAESVATYKTLKKDAKAIAQGQILRLELIMCAGRRFDAAVFRNFFVGHPLMIHLVRRVLWGVYDEGALMAAFRVAEDRTFADAGDEPYDLPEAATVGVAHRLDLDDATCAAWAQVFGDYEILQPFDQLGRAVFRPTDDERKAAAMKRLTGVSVKTGKVLGLEGRGWHRGMPQDAGWVWDYYKPLPGGLRAELGLEGGICVGWMEGTPAEQKLGDLVLRKDEGAGTDVSFGQLPLGVFSELVRDLEAMRD